LIEENGIYSFFFGVFLLFLFGLDGMMVGKLHSTSRRGSSIDGRPVRGREGFSTA